MGAVGFRPLLHELEHDGRAAEGDQTPNESRLTKRIPELSGDGSSHRQSEKHLQRAAEQDGFFDA